MVTDSAGVVIGLGNVFPLGPGEHEVAEIALIVDDAWQGAGIGALLIRDLALVESSGGQEQGYRGGTENVPGALGFAAALEAPHEWFERTAILRHTLDDVVREHGGEVIADASPRIPTIAAYRMPGRSAAARRLSSTGHPRRGLFLYSGAPGRCSVPGSEESEEACRLICQKPCSHSCCHC